MSPAEVLRQLADLSGVTRLIAWLGHRPLWQELPRDPPLVPGVRHSALVGRAGGFEWVGMEGSPAAAVARRAAVLLAARGQCAGIIVLDFAAATLGLAVTGDQPAVAVISLHAPGPSDLERLERLARAADLRGVAYALRAAEILETEDPGRRFFLAFRNTLHAMAGRLTGGPPAGARQNLALIQLTRILFLYFVQAKGWLDGRPDFLRRAVDDALARRRRLHRDLFRPLFFGTLNRPPAGRGRARAFGAIPFLNGGLFEPHPLERAWRGEVPDDCWRDTFDGLFERFHFAVHEDAPPGVIAPDMLGRVFEGLMAPEDRRAAGAYYTPAALVERMVDAALAAHLSLRLRCPAAEAAARLAAREPAAIAPLSHLTLLDPAVGSGAFLLGALDRLAALRADEAPPPTLRRRILAANLFGVDRNPMAVRLAELRLWLSVIAEDDTRDPGQVSPLPNLDGFVRQGDSLLDPASLLARLEARPVHTEAQLRAARAGFVTASGAGKADLLRRLRRAEAAAFAECLAAAEVRIEHHLTECLGAARQVTLFGERRGLDPELRAALRGLRLQQREVRRLTRRLRQEGEVGWFSYEIQFGDVLARGGFDLILGNPPWVRAESLPPRLRLALSRRYRCWRSGGQGFAHQPDLSLAFVERGVELLAPGGTLAFLLPVKLATAGYARALRADLAAQCTLQVMADLQSDPAAGFEATTYPAALILSRAAPDPAGPVRLALDPSAPALPQAAWQGGGPWRLGTPELARTLADLAHRHPRLGARWSPQLGVKTGANALYLEPPADIEPALIRPALRGRDVRAFAAVPRLRLLYPHDAHGAAFERLPAAARAYLTGHERILRARADFAGGPFWALFRTAAATGRSRVVWPDLARQLNAAPLSGPAGRAMVPLNSCYVLTVPDDGVAFGLAAWLNCTWLRVAARAQAEAAASGFARFNARVVADLPLPAAALDDARLRELGRRGCAGQDIQEELDDCCAEHLALSPAERACLAGAPGAGPHDRGRVAARR